jgi:hypothetical protein
MSGLGDAVHADVELGGVVKKDGHHLLHTLEGWPVEPLQHDLDLICKRPHLGIEFVVCYLASCV